MFEKLTVSFDTREHEQFVERVNKSNNIKAKKLLIDLDTSIGFRCNDCNQVLPFYRYSQRLSSKTGLYICKCMRCTNQNICPFKKIFNVAKRRNQSVFKTGEPDFDLGYLKKLYFEIQGCKCKITNQALNLEYGNGNPHNLSLERIDNKRGYFKDNVVFICLWLQVGHTYNFTPIEWRDIITYESKDDGFVFDKSCFIQSTQKKRIQQRKRRNTYSIKNVKGIVISKVCTDCGIRKSSSLFSKTEGRLQSYCNSCNVLRAAKIRNTTRGFIIKLCHTAKANALKRSKIKGRYDTANEIASNLFDLIVELVINQDGRCNYTGIPLRFETKHIHAVSLDRIDDGKGYIRGNLQLIISPLNTSWKPTKEEFLKCRDSILGL